MHPYEVYRSATKLSMTDREMEAAVLTKGAQLLQACQREWGAPDRRQKLDEALRFHQHLWSIFQTELAKADHPLPVELRRDILSLGAFIDQRIFDVMAYPAPEKLTVIINISLNLAAGLRQGAAANAEGAAAPQRDVPEEQETAIIWA